MKKNVIMLLVFSLTGASEQLFAQQEQRLPETSKTITIQIDGDEVRMNGTLLDGDIDSGSGSSKKRGRIFLNDQNFIWEEPNRQEFSSRKKSWEKMDTVTFLGVMTETGESGLNVTDVSKSSPAEKAGLQVGDVILKVDDEKMEDSEGLQKLIRSKRPGEEVRIQIKRGGKKQRINVMLGMKKELRLKVMVFAGDKNTNNLKLNDLLKEVEEGVSKDADRFVDRMLEVGDDMKDIDVRVIRGNQKPKLGLKIQDTEEENGARVLQVTPGSAADKAGLKANDMLVEIDGEPIRNTDDARNQLEDSEDKLAYPVVVDRNGQRMRLEIKFPKSLKTTDL
jgi:serine protease Do